MRIDVTINRAYDTGVHPEVTMMIIDKEDIDDFLKSDRFPNLVDLECRLRPARTLELSCASLKRLSCTNCQLIVLKLNCPSLKVLWCGGNELRILKLNCPSLEALDCSNNQLTVMKVNYPPFPADGENAELQSDDTSSVVVHCPGLLELWCHENSLTKLEVNCPNLRTLVCHNNLIAELKIDCPSLEALDCYRNRLADLNGLEFCSELKLLRASKELEGFGNILKLHLPDLEFGTC